MASNRKMVRKTTDSDSSWGAFAPVMPTFVRLVAGVAVLLVIQVVVLNFPGIQDTISGTSLTLANLIAFFVGLLIAFIVLRFGTLLASAIAGAYRAYKSWTPLLAFVFQIIAIAIIYSVSHTLAGNYFASTPYALPLIFLLIALIPTIKAVVTLVHVVEGHPSPRHSQNSPD